MLNKIIALILTSITILFVIPSANANYYDRRYESYDDDYGNYHSLRIKKMHRYTNNKHHNHRTARRHTDTPREFDRVPFPAKIGSTNIIKVDLGKLAWGAYNDQGDLVKWGPASGGKNYCPDIHRGCKTITGTYTIYKKQGPSCKSSRFPVKTHGGAPMPYCMHFKGGYALHGGNVPNYNASHGCVRLLFQDAQWLNQNFVRVGSTRVSISY